MTMVRSPAIRLAALFWRAGQGIAAYVAAGNLTVIRCRDTFRGLLGYAHTLSGKRQVKYFANGSVSGFDYVCACWGCRYGSGGWMPFFLVPPALNQNPNQPIYPTRPLPTPTKPSRPYTEVKKDPVVLKPPRFNAFTPSPKPWNPTKAPKRALQAVTTAMANTTSSLFRAANIFQHSIEAYDGPSAACFDGVTVTDAKGGRLPPAGEVVKGLMAGQAMKDMLTGGTTDCDGSPFMGSDFKVCVGWYGWRGMHVCSRC